MLPDARKQCVAICGRLHGELQKFPKEWAYRIALEKMIEERVALFKDETKSDEQVEKEMEEQLEEFVENIEEEITLLPSLREGKPWDVPDNYEIPIEMKSY